MKYRKKPVVIEAFQLGVDVEPDWFKTRVGKDVTYVDPEPFVAGAPSDVLIKTLEGTMRANYYEWIIKGVKGEIYPCKPDIFEATYELAHEATGGSDV